MSMWVARDYNGDLYLYFKKPIKNLRNWMCNSFCKDIDKQLFPEAKWEDEEPIEVELVIKKQK